MKKDNKTLELIKRREARKFAQNRFAFMLQDQRLDNIQRQENDKNVKKIMTSNDIDFKKLMIKNGVKPK
jgi:hypothetical protein|tara:strand:- start:283 stop:489 length:207 start_codon:yes stop_codon:yes gene_type:complete